MRTFGTLMKNELKLNIRNMNMVIFGNHHAADCPGYPWISLWHKTCSRWRDIYFFGAVFWCALHHLHLCRWTDGITACGI